MSAILWLVGGVLMMALEFLVPGVIIIFFGLAGVVVAATTALGLTITVASQLSVWVVLSLVFVIFLRRSVQRLFPALDRDEHADDHLVNETGITLTDVDGKTETGRVRLQGTSWTAYSFDGALIVKGTQIKVIRQDNLTVYVVPLNNIE